MKTIYNIYEGLLAGMDDTLDKGESIAINTLIANWLNSNYDYAKMFSSNIELDASSRMNVNSDNEIDLITFQPMQPYMQEQMMALPAPEYIKFNNVESMTIIYPDMSYKNKFKFEDIPHTNYCKELFIKGFVDGLIYADLGKLPIDHIKALSIDLASIRPKSWPNGKVEFVNLLTGGYLYGEYTDEEIKRYNHDITIDDLKGLKTDSLAIPDIMFTRRNGLIGWRVDFEITQDDPEYEALKHLFDMKVCKNLYAYSARGRADMYRQIKFKKDKFIISRLNANLYKKYYM